jgi:hypothetical protein
MTYTSLQSSQALTCSKYAISSGSASGNSSGGGAFSPQGTDSRYIAHRRSPSGHANVSSSVFRFGLFGSFPKLTPALTAAHNEILATVRTQASLAIQPKDFIGSDELIAGGAGIAGRGKVGEEFGAAVHKEILS